MTRNTMIAINGSKPAMSIAKLEYAAATATPLHAVGMPIKMSSVVHGFGWDTENVTAAADAASICIEASWTPPPDELEG